MRLSRAFGEPVQDLWPRLAEVESRLQATYDTGEPDVESRLDYWLGSVLSAYLNRHRKKGATALKLKDVTPRWGWESKSDADEQQRARNAGVAMFAWLKAMSKRAEKPKPKANGVIASKRKGK